MLFPMLAAKAYAQNLQYRAAHLVHNAASTMFGYMYACIWIGLGDHRSLGEYGLTGMISYIAFTQAALWISGFMTNGLGIPESVRTGRIALELMRPVHLFPHLMAKAWGVIGYQFLHKSIPIYLVYLLIFPLHVPTTWKTAFLTVLSLCMAAYLAICINYLIGVSALWTTESDWLHWSNHALIMLLSGFFIPIEWLPSWLQSLSLLSPYPFLMYVPVRIYLGHESGEALAGAVLWAVGLTLVCFAATALMRRKVEVQGG